jgi:hypothetical protein
MTLAFQKTLVFDRLFPLFGLCLIQVPADDNAGREGSHIGAGTNYARQFGIERRARTTMAKLSVKESPAKSTLGRLWPLALVATLAGSPAFAGPITYTVTATATGTFAGTAFTDATITVTSLADTTDVIANGSFNSQFGGSPNYEVLAFTSSISITGFTTATFTDPTFWEDPTGAGDIIFGDAALATGILGFTHLGVGLETYNLGSSFGPVSSNFDFETSAFNTFMNIPTSEGLLSLVASGDTFTAVAAAPEPSTFLIAGLRLLGLLAMRHQIKDFHHRR